jgi:phosphoesterase RecJ-like protein
MQSDQILRKIKEIVDTTNSILITGQAIPDGDSLGSQLALHDILVQQKQNARTTDTLDIVISNDSPPPLSYKFFPNIHLVTSFDDVEDRQFDVGFILDSSRDRVGKVLQVLQKCRYTINIDHHQSRTEGNEDVSWVDHNICSVAEMIYEFFEHPDWNVSITSHIAACLYAGIIYDTGSFRYPKTTPRTHQIVAKLLETGIDFAKISEQLFLETTFSKLGLLRGVLQSLQRDPSGEIIWGTITQKLLKTVHAQPGEDGGIITQYAFTKGTKVAVLFKELSPRTITVSFRSRGEIDVGHFARKVHEKGGGHSRAAGCSFDNKTIEEVQELVLNALQKELQNNRTNSTLP